MIIAWFLFKFHWSFVSEDRSHNDSAIIDKQMCWSRPTRPQLVLADPISIVENHHNGCRWLDANNGHRTISNTIRLTHVSRLYNPRQIYCITQQSLPEAVMEIGNAAVSLYTERSYHYSNKSWSERLPPEWLQSDTALWHWRRGEVVAILQTTFWNAFCWIKVIVLGFTFYWGFFQSGGGGGHLTIS